MSGQCSYIYHQRCWAPEEAHRGDALAHDYMEGHAYGEAHRYAIVCDVCGEHGTVVLTIEPRTSEPEGLVAR